MNLISSLSPNLHAAPRLRREIHLHLPFYESWNKRQKSLKKKKRRKKRILLKFDSRLVWSNAEKYRISWTNFLNYKTLPEFTRHRIRLNEFIWTPRCFVGEQAIFFCLAVAIISFFLLHKFSSLLVFHVYRLYRECPALIWLSPKRRAYSQANLKLARSIVEIVVTVTM